MMDAESTPVELDRFRGYLMLLARLQMGGRLRQKEDASDIVQHTMMAAIKHWPRFQDKAQGEVMAWLRTVLAHAITDFARAWGRGKRDAGRERSIQQSLDASSIRLENWLAAEQSTPSQKLERMERVVEVANALTQLPLVQRECLVMKYCEGKSLVDIGAALDKSPEAVSSLLQRGSRNLRKILSAEEGSE